MIFAASSLPLPVVAIAVGFFLAGRWTAHVDYKRGKADGARAVRQVERARREQHR